ncbi:hypothetical protein EDB87DRAFT_1599216 [Lactarius vividus]|nr:hypothetical protein EDB87DRAFT_1599216 [Lactarius vividus]
MSNNTVTIPPRLSRRSSIWSILRSLETLSSPPSWSSLDSLATHSQLGSIPLIFRGGGEDLPGSISFLRFDTERDVSLQHLSTIRLLDHTLAIKDDNTGAKSQEHKDVQTTSLKALIDGPTAHPTLLVMRPYPPMSTGSCTYLPRPLSQPACSEEEAHQLGLLQVETATPPVPSEQLAPQLRSSHGYSSTPSISVHDPSLDSRRSSSTTEGLSPTKGSHGHGGYTPLHSDLPLATHDGVHTFTENLDVGSGRFPLLPSSLSWLKSTVLELMIDQEGFRMIQPTFKLAGYSRPSAMESGATLFDSHLVSATADFMPAERKSFTFHHASLDTPPVFRRLLVNGDESHDYLSRQAYLILKANGPYTVHGTEPVQSPRLFPNSEPPVLSWRFDYFVGDRRTETGKIIHGEKTLTPLSFSCSPGLLQPTQARKIRVVHVVKKSVAPKLTATKMEPPVPQRRHLVLSSVPTHNAALEHQGINTTCLTDSLP